MTESNPKFIFFVKEGCRPCIYAKANLERCEDWDKVVEIQNVEVNGEWSQYAYDLGVHHTPTVVALQEGKVVAMVTGADNFTRHFWQSTIDKWKPS